MNRWLYAQADPATLVDPTGHCAMAQWDAMCGEELASAAAAAATWEFSLAAIAAGGAVWFTSCALGIGCPGVDATPLPDGQVGPHKMGPPPVATTHSTTSAASGASVATTAAPAPTAGADPGVWLKSQGDDPTHVKDNPIKVAPRVELPSNDNFPLPPAGGCGGSMVCKAVSWLLIGVLGGGPAASGLTGHQASEGDTPASQRDDLQPRRSGPHVTVYLSAPSRDSAYAE
jgi:hypothetical protein